MLIWILALVLFGALGVIGYYQGALRVSFSFIGLIVAALLALPLSGVFGWVFGIFGLEHPVVLAFLSPFAAFVIVLICFKAGGLATHKKVDTWFKYKASDTVRLLYNRMNSRVGIAVGMLNAFVYLIILSVVIYVVGYFFLQVRVSNRDSFAVKTLARLADDLRETKMDQAVAAFIPKLESYYDGADVLADIFLNPLLQNRLSTYPVFLMLNEQPQYRQLAGSPQFQDFWQKTPSLQEFRSHALILPMVESTDWYTKMRDMLGGDYKDLKTYLETGKSPKYDEEVILGRWDYDGAASFALARKRRPIMPQQEIKRLRAVFGTLFKDTQITCAPQNKAVLKLPNFPEVRGTRAGSWERGAGSAYTLRTEEGSKDLKAEALVDGKTMTVTIAGFALVFER